MREMREMKRQHKLSQNSNFVDCCYKQCVVLFVICSLSFSPLQDYNVVCCEQVYRIYVVTIL